jgi:hypothetical protein
MVPALAHAMIHLPLLGVRGVRRANRDPVASRLETGEHDDVGLDRQVGRPLEGPGAGNEALDRAKAGGRDRLAV